MLSTAVSVIVCEPAEAICPISVSDMWAKTICTVYFFTVR
jgi:hypothetical protein